MPDKGLAFSICSSDCAVDIQDHRLEGTHSKAYLPSFPKVYQSRTQQHVEAAMIIDGSYFFSDELEDLADSAIPRAPRQLRDRSPDEGDPMEGETLPEDALRAIRAWLGF